MRLFSSALLLSALASLCAAAPPAGSSDYTNAERRHWAFQPRAEAQPPVFEDAADKAWVRSPVDAFVLEEMKKRGLSPAPAADRVTLIRRMYFDLLGLPPTPEQVDRFVTDRDPNAVGKVIEDLLASPHYGERWAQHWLDVVRFAETDGFEYDRHRNGAWRFRDWVIRSFNDDKPYDRFLMEQLAGDELDSENHDYKVAVGLNRLGPLRLNAGNQEIVFSRGEVLVEMTNIVGSGMLAMTVGCARCHDHKFDPIRHKDYYRLQAYFASTFPHDVPVASKAVQADWKATVEAIDKEIEDLRKQIEALREAGEREKARELRSLVAEKEKLKPEPLPAIFSVESKPEEATPIHVLERGQDELKGEKVGMRPLGVLLPDDYPEMPLSTPGARRRLAEWIASPENPLTARVMANRIWKYHFGRGIVENPNDFGRMGGLPTHRALLDYLANQFIARGWSVKSMHRLILASSTYQQAFRTPRFDEFMTKDPENKYLWHYARKRLEAEQIRDAMLAVAGTLNAKTGGESIMIPVQEELVGRLYKPSQWQVHEDPREHDRRSIYLIAKRNLRLPFMEVFDAPDRLQSCARRESSTHAPQSLEMLNGDFANRMADAFAERLEREAPGDRAGQIDRAYRLTTGRAPTPQERDLALGFLETEPLREFALAALNLSAFLYIE